MGKKNQKKGSIFGTLSCINGEIFLFVTSGSKDDSTYIVQTLDFHLGHNTMVTKPCGALESPMATITKITRRRHENPPHGVATVKEWFGYVTAMRNEGRRSLRLLTDAASNLLNYLVTNLVPIHMGQC